MSESGGDSYQRAEEAMRIVRLLKDVSIADMRPNDGDMVIKTKARLNQYGLRAFVSPEQLFYLRDILERYT